MRRQTLLTLTAAAGVMFCFSARGAIDFNRLYRIAEAERIFGRKDFVEARAEFKDLAGSAADPVEQAVLSARAAIALGCQAGQYESALEEAAGIKNQTVADYARITLLASKSDWAGMIEQFGDAPIADWPVIRLPTRPRAGAEDMRVYGLIKRADAFDRTGSHRQAAQDLEKAVEISSDWRCRLLTLIKLANVRQNRLDDDAGAYEVNKQIAAIGRGGAPYYVGTMAAANYLSRNGRHDEALAMLDVIVGSLHSTEISTGWQGRILVEKGRILRDAGRPAEAAEVFQAVVTQKNNNPEQRRASALEAAAALAAAGNTSEAIAVYRRLLEMEGITEAQREQAQTAIRELQGPE